MAAAQAEPNASRHAPRLRAWLAIIVLVFGLPLTAISRAADPVTLGEWMRTIYVTPDREIDMSQDGVPVASSPPPAPTVQTSSEPAPKEPVARTNLPRLWLSQNLKTTRRRRAGRSRTR